MRRCKTKSICLLANNECEKRMADELLNCLMYNGYDVRMIPFRYRETDYALIEWRW